MSPPSFRFESRSPEETHRLGLRLGRSLAPGSVVCLEGPLGAGKTVFVKGLAEALGIRENITSPTFTLIVSYPGEGVPLHHIDLYRLDGPADIEELGLDELFGGSGVCVIEWGERARDYLPEGTIGVTLRINPDGGRDIRIDGWNSENLSD